MRTGATGHCAGPFLFGGRRCQLLEVKRTSRGPASMSDPKIAYYGGLRAGARDEAANLGVAVAVIVGPHNSRAEPVGLSYNSIIRHDEPLSVESYTIVPICVSQSTSWTLTPSAKVQHNPFLLASRSNHSLSGELAKRPSSRACDWFGTNIVMHTTAATTLNADLNRQPTNATRRWASTSTAVTGSAGN